MNALIAAKNTKGGIKGGRKGGSIGRSPPPSGGANNGKNGNKGQDGAKGTPGKANFIPGGEGMPWSMCIAFRNGKCEYGKSCRKMHPNDQQYALLERIVKETEERRVANDAQGQ